MQISDVHGRKWGEAELYTYLYNAYLISLSYLLFRMILFVSDQQYISINPHWCCDLSLQASPLKNLHPEHSWLYIH